MSNVSRETEEKLQEFLATLLKWNPRINLVAPDTLQQARFRHVDDCLQLADLASKPMGDWVDLGSGGGFPGLIVAIAMRDEPVKFTLVESDTRKSAFLRTVARDLDLPNVVIKAERAEKIPPMHASQISARALAPLDRLLAMVAHHIKPNGTAWLMKGRRWQEECEAARRLWSFDVEPFQSKTDPDAAILKITGVSAHG
ncbi:16S rRNA (guanine(527)-N(7))-methyltransferase RsmG [Paracoccus rhizosphaerae]|uniref:Ribosomal RNA small subunit methyltransferase G n=1 Tax=Paracoccus rhizosphaerae TaxID=1133347 RepID=A0ABV6CQ18_9RHOB|nr:16S rRNA (guanine(527)-N(7))-methyltransferase RsmG [Paracoccus rhizosphaerae]